MSLFDGLAKALEGRPALQQRARQADLSLVIRSGERATTVRIGETIVGARLGGRRIGRCIRQNRI